MPSTAPPVSPALAPNTDRWADDGVFSRDLIDLAMLELPRPLLQKALAKAAAAYGSAIENDLRRSIERLEQRTGRLQECMTALKMTDAPARVWKQIRRLRPRPAARKLVEKSRR